MLNERLEERKENVSEREASSRRNIGAGLGPELALLLIHVVVLECSTSPHNEDMRTVSCGSLDHVVDGCEKSYPLDCRFECWTAM